MRGIGEIAGVGEGFSGGRLEGVVGGEEAVEGGFAGEGGLVGRRWRDRGRG